MPHLLVIWLQEKGYDTIHATALATGDRITNNDICQHSMDEQRVVITKDDDFLTTYLLKKQPYKLMYLTVGNLKNRQLLNRFRTDFDSWEFQLEVGANVIEVSQYDTKVRD